VSLVYRAIWQDDRNDLIEAATESFTAWVIEKYPEMDIDSDESVLELEDTTAVSCVRVVAADDASLESADGTVVSCARVAVATDDVAATELILREDLVTDRWVTSLRVLFSADEQWLWVDLSTWPKTSGTERSRLLPDSCGR
jgi:hypothetical protein